MKVISVMSRKGGVGKTSVAVNVADRLAAKGYRVLVIDGDHQGNATTALLDRESEQDFEISAAEIIANPTEYAIKDAILPTITERLFIVPSDVRLREVDARTLHKRNREKILKKQLDSVSDLFDYVIVDCSPGGIVMVENAAIVADAILIMVDPSVFSQSGLGNLFADLEDIYDGEIEIPVRIALHAVAKNQIEVRDTIQLLKESLPQHYDGRLDVRVSQVPRRALRYNKTVRTFAKGNLINNDYEKIQKWMEEPSNAS